MIHLKDNMTWSILFYKLTPHCLMGSNPDPLSIMYEGASSFRCNPFGGIFSHSCVTLCLCCSWKDLFYVPKVSLTPSKLIPRYTQSPRCDPCSTKASSFPEPLYPSWGSLPSPPWSLLIHSLKLFHPWLNFSFQEVGYPLSTELRQLWTFFFLLFFYAQILSDMERTQTRASGRGWSKYLLAWDLV